MTCWKTNNSTYRYPKSKILRRRVSTRTEKARAALKVRRINAIYCDFTILFTPGRIGNERRVREKHADDSYEEIATGLSKRAIFLKHTHIRFPVVINYFSRLAERSLLIFLLSREVSTCIASSEILIPKISTFQNLFSHSGFVFEYPAFLFTVGIYDITYILPSHNTRGIQQVSHGRVYY